MVTCQKCDSLPSIQLNHSEFFVTFMPLTMVLCRSFSGTVCVAMDNSLHRQMNCRNWFCYCIRWYTELNKYTHFVVDQVKYEIKSVWLYKELKGLDWFKMYCFIVAKNYPDVLTWRVFNNILYLFLLCSISLYLFTYLFNSYNKQTFSNL